MKESINQWHYMLNTFQSENMCQGSHWAQYMYTRQQKTTVILKVLYTHTTILRPFFQDYPARRNLLLDFMVQGEILEADTLTHWMPLHLD